MDSVDEVCEKLQQSGVTLNSDKSRIGVREVIFLGHNISTLTVKMMDETKKELMSLKRRKAKKNYSLSWD